MQSADCERHFKDYGRFHTDVRNRLSVEKGYQSTLVLNGLKRKYGSRNDSGKSSKNRSVRAEEYATCELNEIDTMLDETENAHELAEFADALKTSTNPLSVPFA